MKKIIAILAILTTVASVQADIISRGWNSQAITAGISGYPKPPYFLTASESDGDGANWVYEIWNLTDDVAISGNKPASEVTQFGWKTSSLGTGYTIFTFAFNALEGKNVALRIYNNIVKPTGSDGWYLQSQAQILADYDGPDDSTTAKVTFNFAGQTWQQVPEPATFSLIGLVGLGMIVARRRALRKSSDL